ncbi:MAG: NCS2 family permease [Candidatus Omnitrophica bacterium]|nr:NCS2 family permease [Candidatus Omnitrophota bacterium]
MFLEDYFQFRKYNTGLKQEILGGLTTFITMSYIIVVNPAILQAAGIPRQAAFAATVLSAFLGTLLMGVFANRPFAIAPYMGENAFIAYTVCKILGYPWQVGLGAVFLGGVLFTLLTLLGLRSWFARAIPKTLKYSFACGLGLFLMFIGLNTSGIISLGMADAPVKLANLLDKEVLLALFTFVFICSLMARKVKGAILLGLTLGTALALLLGFVKFPSSIISLDFSLRPTAFQCLGIFRKPQLFLNGGFLIIVLTVFIMDFVDTIGTLIGVSARANLLDEKGNLSDIEKPMLCDALATVFGALCGTTTTGTYIESAAGVEEGARTGFSSVVVALLFLLALFFGPLLTIVPPYVYGPALIIVGILMMQPILKIDFSDYTELIPAFSVIAFTSFSYNLGVGITAGFVLYLVLKLIAGKFKDLNLGLVVLGLISLLFFMFYPYH